MPRSGAGVYTTPPGTDAVSLATISSVDFNTLVSDIKDALTDSLSKSGNGAATADISMGTHKITNLAAAVGSADAPRFDQIQPVDADLTAIAALDATAGLLAKTAANTYARRTITGAGGVTIANGAGTAADPIIRVLAPVTPGGRLTLVTGVPVLVSDQASKTTLYYTSFESNYLPIWDGTYWTTMVFASDLSIALDSNSGHTGYHQALKAFDVFGFSDSGTLRIGTGAAWSVAGNYVSAGSLTTGTASRGAGAGTTELERTNGLYVNKNSITLRWGSASGNTVVVPAGQATYLGTIWMDATDGQLSCHVSYGQNRKYGVCNAYNRVPIVLQAGDSGSAWAAYNTATIRAANGTAANGLTVLCGLPEETVLASYLALVTAGASARTPTIGVGYNSTTAISGRKSTIIVGANLASDQLASYEPPPFIGLGAFISLQSGDGSATTVWTNGSAADELRAVWRG